MHNHLPYLLRLYHVFALILPPHETMVLERKAPDLPLSFMFERAEDFIHPGFHFVHIVFLLEPIWSHKANRNSVRSWFREHYTASYMTCLQLLISLTWDQLSRFS